jgi:hypothetical protein
MPRVERLVVVAGPPLAGKSTTIRSLANGELSFVRDTLEIGDFTAWRVIDASRIERLEDAHLPRLLLHYDFLRPWRRAKGERYGDDPALKLLADAAEITFLTLRADGESLRRRVRARRVSIVRSIFNPIRIHLVAKRLRRLPNMRRLETLYADAPELQRRYDEWFGFCGGHAARQHWILDTTSARPALEPLGEWSRSGAHDLVTA